MPFQGAEEAYYAMPFRGQDAFLNQLNQGTRQKLDQSRWQAEEGIQEQKDKYAAIDRAVQTTRDRYDKNYARAYGEQQDARTEKRAQAQDQRLAAEEGRANERMGWERQEQPIRLESQKAQMEGFQRDNRKGAAEEAWGNELYDATHPELGSNAAYGRRQGLRAGEANIKATEAQTTNSNAQARLAQQQAADAKRAQMTAEAQSRLSGIASEALSAQQQADDAKAELAKAQASGDTQAAVAAQQALQQAQQRAVAINRDLAETQAFYSKKGLGDYDLQSAYRGAQGDARRNQQQSHEVFKLTDEGQEFSGRKQALDAKMAALDAIVRESKNFKQASFFGKSDEAPRANIQAELQKIGKGTDAQTLDDTFSFEGTDGFSTRQTRVDRITDRLEQEVRGDLAALKERSGASQQPLVRQEIRRLESVLSRIESERSSANGNLNVFAGGGAAPGANAAMFQPQDQQQAPPMGGVMQPPPGVNDGAFRAAGAPRDQPQPVLGAAPVSRFRQNQIHQPMPAAGARR